MGWLSRRCSRKRGGEERTKAAGRAAEAAAEERRRDRWDGLLELVVEVRRCRGRVEVGSPSISQKLEMLCVRSVFVFVFAFGVGGGRRRRRGRDVAGIGRRRW